MADFANSTTRRKFIRSLTATAAIGVAGAAVAAPEVSDPIFAKIETHRACELEFVKACRLTDEVVARREGRSVTEEDEAVRTASNNASHAAWSDLVGTVPTTMAGIRALLTYAHGQDDWAFRHDYEYELLGDVIDTVLASPALEG